MGRLSYIEFKTLNSGAVLTHGRGQWQESEAFSLAIDAVKVLRDIAEREIERYNKEQAEYDER